jgi:signal transduction histidine kinase
MSQQRSLKRVLTYQWTAFTLVLAALFFGAGLLLLYILEDSFIDRRLKDVAGTIVDLDTPPPLPTQFSYFAVPGLSEELRERFENDRAGHIEEFWRQDGRYVHALLTQTLEGAPFVLLYDATDELTVNAGIRNSLPYALPLLALLALCAYAMAGTFVSRVGKQARRMVEQVRVSSDPESLRTLAEREPIQELSELARLNAEIWSDKLAAVESERRTLAFLAHELRTPLQSARTSLALLQDERANGPAWQRLQRALNRLIRASNSILWLSSTSPPQAHEPARVHEIVAELAEELAPLAAMKGQTLELSIQRELASGEITWPWPRDAVEAVIANLLLNAIQHGTAGVIHIEVNPHVLFVSNPSDSQTRASGFGMGLQIVERLIERFAWEMAVDADAEEATVKYTVRRMEAGPHAI